MVNPTYVFSWLDLFPYFFLTLLILVLSKFKFRYINNTYCIYFVLLIFACLRYGIGYDYYNYKKVVLGEMPDFVFDKMEPLAKLFVNVASTIHYQVFFILFALVTLYPLYISVVKKSINPSFSLMLYFLFPIFYLESLSIVRNAAAYSLVLLAFVFFLEHKRVKYFLLMTLAICLHKSAFVGFLLLPICYFQFGRKVNFVIYLLSFFLSAWMLFFLTTKVDSLSILKSVSNYALNGAVGAGNTMMIIINLLGILNFIFWKKLEIVNRDGKLLLNIVNCGVVLWNLFAFEGTLRLRLSSYFLIFSIILLPNYFYLWGKKYYQLSRQVVTSFFIILFIASFYINISNYIKRNDRMSYFPYQTIFYYKDYMNYLY